MRWTKLPWSEETGGDVCPQPTVLTPRLPPDLWHKPQVHTLPPICQVHAAGQVLLSLSMRCLSALPVEEAAAEVMQNSCSPCAPGEVSSAGPCRGCRTMQLGCTDLRASCARWSSAWATRLDALNSESPCRLSHQPPQLYCLWPEWLHCDWSVMQRGSRRSAYQHRSTALKLT